MIDVKKAARFLKRHFKTDKKVDGALVQMIKIDIAAREDGSQVKKSDKKYKIVQKDVLDEDLKTKLAGQLNRLLGSKYATLDEPVRLVRWMHPGEIELRLLCRRLQVLSRMETLLRSPSVRSSLGGGFRRLRKTLRDEGHGAWADDPGRMTVRNVLGVPATQRFGRATHG